VSSCLKASWNASLSRTFLGRTAGDLARKRICHGLLLTKRRFKGLRKN
jgi:hypothetical protein